MEKEHREKQDCCRAFRRGGSFICAPSVPSFTHQTGKCHHYPHCAHRSGVFAYSNPAAPAAKSWFLIPIPALGRILVIIIIMQTGFAERDDFRNGDSWETVMEPHLSHE